MASFQNFPRFNRESDDPADLAKTKWKDGRCCWTEQRAERTHSRLRPRDGKQHGPAMNQTVAARALGWRSEMSAVNRTHWPARRKCGDESIGFVMFLVPVKVPVNG